jgi:hypothetical protein
MKYVISGDYSEFEQWIIKNNYSLFDYTYVYDEIGLRGVHNPEGVFVGSYRKREDILRVVAVLLTCLPHNADGKYNKIWSLYYELQEEKKIKVPGSTVGSILRSNPVGNTYLNVSIGHPGSGGSTGGSVAV